MGRRFLVLVWVIGWTLACSGGPASTRQGALTVAWLERTRAGDDGRAVAMLGLPHDAPVPFGPDEFGKRADRLPLLRTHDRVELTKVERIKPDISRPKDPLGELVLRGIARLNPTYEVQGILWKGPESADFDLRVNQGALKEITVRGQRLIPRSNYHVIEAPPPLDEAPELHDVTVGFDQVGEAHFVKVTGELNGAVEKPGILLETTCVEGDRVYRHATRSGHSDAGHKGWRPFSLSDRVGGDRPDRCDVWLRIHEDAERQVRFCVDGAGFREGRCPVEPRPVGPATTPIAVDQVAVDVQDAGITVHYTLTPNEPMPVRYNTPDHATLVTEVACAQGTLEAHRRPLHEQDDLPGIHRRYGSVLVARDVPALGLPCHVALRYVRDDGFDNEQFVAWEGCRTAAGLQPGACP